MSLTQTIFVGIWTDALRLFEMFLGPLEQSKPWKTSGISGVYSFLKKLWKLYHNGDTFKVVDVAPTKDELKTLHRTIKKVEEDMKTSLSILQFLPL